MQWRPGRQFMKLRQHMRHFFVSYLVLVFCLGASLSLWQLTRQSVEREGLLRFETRSKDIAAAIEARMHTYVQTLYQTRGLFLTRGIPDHDEFATYVRTVNISKNYPGVQGIGFSLRIPRDGLSSHHAAMHARGFHGYAVYPRDDRSEYHSIMMLEPMDWHNKRAFGYDMHTHSVRSEAMDRARDTGLPQATKIVTLVQETRDQLQPGFLVYLPVYQSAVTPDTVELRRNTLLGFVYSPFRAHDFFRGIFDEVGFESDLDFEVYDRPGLAAKHLLYDRDGRLRDLESSEISFRTSFNLEVPGGSWTLHVHSRPAFDRSLANRLPVSTLITGLVFSGLVYFLVLNHTVKIRREQQLLAEAHRELAERRRTEAELRNSEESYRVLSETISHGVWTANPLGLVTYINRWWQQYTGLALSVNMPENWQAVVHPQHSQRLLQWLQATDPGQVSEIEIPFRHATDGSYRWHLARRSAVSGLDHKVRQWVTVAIDIHQLKELEQERSAREEELRIITNALPALISYTDAGQVLRFVNAEYERWFARPLASILGRTMDELWSQSLINPKEELASRHSALSGQRVSFETTLRHSDGSLRPMKIVYVPRLQGAGQPSQGFFALITDLSAMRSMEQQLEENQERFEFITGSVHLGLWFCDLPFKNLLWNPWVKEQFWLASRAEAGVETLYARLHPDDRERIQRSIHKALEQRLTLDEEFRTVNPESGAIKWVRAIGRGYYDTEGRASRFDGVSLDISEQKNKECLLHQQMRTTDTLSKIGRILTAELDLKRLLQIMTDSATEAIGASFGVFYHHSEEARRQGLSLFTLSGAPYAAWALPSLSLGAELMDEKFLSLGIIRSGDLTKDARMEPSHVFFDTSSRQRPLRSYLAVPVKTRSDLIIGGLFFGHEEADRFHDTAESLLAGIAVQASIAIENATLFHKAEDELIKRREAEENLRTLNEELEARVRDRTNQLQTANRELEAFAYSVSHDLRAPLRGIDGFSSILDKRYAHTLDEQGRHYLKRIKDAAGRMSHLIDDMLNLTRLTRQDMQKSQVDLSALAQSVARFLSEAETQRELTFVIHAGMQAFADPILMRAVLENLIGNAWKFTSHRPTGARIEVGSEARDGKLIFFVKDNGAGFDMEYAEKLFRPFQRLHSMQEFPGSGIGLASVQRIIHRHGGEVWAEGRVNEGASFYFTVACSERDTA